AAGMQGAPPGRAFLGGGAAPPGARLAAGGQAVKGQGPGGRPPHQHPPAANESGGDYPRDHPGPGGPVGSATDRGKLVPGLRGPGEPPVPVLTPDLPKLPFTMKDGVKEFHLVARHTRREFLPGAWVDVWGYNDSIPAPPIH